MYAPVRAPSPRAWRPRNAGAAWQSMRAAQGRPGRLPLPLPAGNGPVWLFDLDNTLHDTSHAIFGQIDTRMREAVMAALSVDADVADALRVQYWRRYGATLIGMVRHHGVDPQRFLHHSHDFDVRPLLRHARGLAQALQRLPGHRVLFTNAPLSYAMAVLRALGIQHLFHQVWGVEEMRLFGRYLPKPSARMLRRVAAREGWAPQRVTLLDDTPSNLRAARAVGMRTVYVWHPGSPLSVARRGRPHYVDERQQGGWLKQPR